MKALLMKFILSATFLLLLGCMHESFAQTKDSLLRVYNNETIHPFGRFYIKGSKQLNFRNLKPDFTSDITKNLYKKSKENLILGRLISVTAVAALVSGALIKKDNKGAGIALSIAGIGLNLYSFSFRKRSKELIDQAIWHRNKEILFGTQQ